MSTIQNIEKEIIEDFSFFDNWTDKYEYVIELGQKSGGLSDEFKISKYKIKGCQSNVWLIAELKDGKVHYKFDSDSLFVKGLASLLVKLYDMQNADEIVSNEPQFIEAIGLKQHLAPTRAGGLAAMLKQIKLYALAFQSANKVE